MGVCGCVWVVVFHKLFRKCKVIFLLYFNVYSHHFQDILKVYS